jgi:endonuclease/exonuclease/phosphatase family metal-dependent hydrolase
VKIILLIKKYFKNICILLNVGIALLLLLSYLAAYINPLEFYQIAFLGLIYPILFILNLIFVLFWMVQKSKFILISVICILIGWKFLTGFLQVTLNEKNPEKINQKMKVLSYNVRIFDLWNWSLERHRSNKIFNFIKKSKANIVCLQEFYSKNETGKNAKDSLLINSGLKYCYIVYTKRNNRSTNYGIATFTSFPIINSGEIKMDEGDNFCIFTDLYINKDTIRVYNIHLASLHLGEEDYELIENINNNDTINVQGMRSIFWKFKVSYKKRAKQVNTIVSHLATCQYPVILCGDFNDTPISYAYQQLSNHLEDAFRLSGNGIGSTYINKYKTFRIDYILHSPNLKSFCYTSPHIRLSDHYPVQCYFELN